MIQEKPKVDRFKEQMRDSLQRETLHSHSITFAKHKNVYTCGDNDELVYFIESGQIKLLMLLPQILCALEQGLAVRRLCAVPDSADR